MVVCCHNNERYFLVRYFIKAPLLVIIHISIGVTLPVLKNEIKDFFFARLGTGGNYDPTLLFGIRTERINVCKIWNRCGIYILKTQRCCFIYKFKTHKNGRYPSRVQKRNQRFLFHAVGHRKDFKVPSRYVAYTYLYKKIP